MRHPKAIQHRLTLPPTPTVSRWAPLPQRPLLSPGGGQFLKPPGMGWTGLAPHHPSRRNGSLRDFKPWGSFLFFFCFSCGQFCFSEGISREEAGLQVRMTMTCVTEQLLLSQAVCFAGYMYLFTKPFTSVKFSCYHSHFT